MANNLDEWLTAIKLHEQAVETTLSVFAVEGVATLDELAEVASDPELLPVLIGELQAQLQSKLALKRLERALAALAVQGLRSARPWVDPGGGWIDPRRG